MSTRSISLIVQANECLSTGNYQSAFDMYIEEFEVAPQLKKINESHFRYVVLYLCRYLEQIDDHEGLFDVYEKVLNIFPESCYIRDAMGRFLLKKGFYTEAWTQFQKILDSQSDSVLAEYYLNIVKSHLIPRWHYRMLNDKTRNFAYRVAIEETVQPNKDSVLDLGSGSGLLAMYAAKCNPDSIVGIEQCHMLCEVAKCVASCNVFPNIKIINKLSTELEEFEINERKTLLVTEIFDAGLFGEGVVMSLDHAFKNLLLDNGRVLPEKAEFFVRGIKSDSLMLRYVLNAHVQKLLNIPSNEFVLTSQDSYDCGDIHLYKDLKYMTNSESLVKVDFNDAADLEKKLSHIEEYSIKLKPTESGEVSTIIGWFNLHLTDNVTLTTDPTSENRANAWQQPIFCNFIPMQVKKDVAFTVNFQLVKGSKLSLESAKTCNFKISESTMRFLNDKLYIDEIIECVTNAFEYTKQLAGGAGIIIADLCPFPIFGFMMLKLGAKMLYCGPKTSDDQNFINDVFAANGISQDRYKFIDRDEYTLKDIKCHAIYYYIFDDTGNVDPIQIRNIHYMQMVNLMDRGLIMPNEIRLMAQVIYSPWLNTLNKVNDANTGYQIAGFMNRFQVSVNYGIDFTHLEYVTFTAPIQLAVCGAMKTEFKDTHVLRTGQANAVLCWYEIDVMKDCNTVTTKRPNSSIDGIAFLLDPEKDMTLGTHVEIMCFVDVDESFKIVIDIN